MDSLHYTPLPLHRGTSKNKASSILERLSSRVKQRPLRPLLLTAVALSIITPLFYLHSKINLWTNTELSDSTPPVSSDAVVLDALPEELGPDMVFRDGVVYHAFPRPTTPQLLKDTLIRPIKSHLALSDACLEHWLTRATWDGPCSLETVEEATIDLVYTWVNGSDPLHQEIRNKFLEGIAHHPLNARFREHDELRHSLRASHKTTQKWRNNKWHIITADVENPDDSSQRLGLVPHWLNTSASFMRDGGRAPIVLHHDSQLFRYARPYETLDEVEAWREMVLPTFNSHAIEVQLSNLDPEIVSENIITLNDDQYLVLEMPPSAFHSALYGPVLRLDTGRPIGGDDSGSAGGEHEWRSMGWSDHLLNTRFGTRQRTYVQHNARSFSVPLMHEASILFADFFTWTPLSRFRGSHGTPPEIEVNTIFLSTHFVVERHREALLWSWVVAKWGGEGGMLTESNKIDMWREAGGLDDSDEIIVRLQEPSTSDAIESNMRAAGLEPPQSSDRSSRAYTNYLWVSQDGFAVAQEGDPLVDKITRSDCLSDKEESAWTLFRRLTMHNPQCGDALLSMLKATSSEPGLSVYLPPASVDTATSLNPDEAHILPLWLPEDPPALPSNLRAFAVRLLHRYSYVIGDTPSRFFGLTTYVRSRYLLHQTDKQTDIALLCINDDMDETGSRVTKVGALYRDWLGKKWPTPLDCEMRT